MKQHSYFGYSIFHRYVSWLLYTPIVGIFGYYCRYTIEKFHGVLSKQTADCKQERNPTSQAKDKNQDTISNEKNDCRGIELDQQALRRICIDWEEKFKVIEQDTKEMKKEWKYLRTPNNTTGRFASTN